MYIQIFFNGYFFKYDVQYLYLSKMTGKILIF